MGGRGDIGQAAEQVHPQLVAAAEAAQRVGHVPVDFLRIATEPVEGRAIGLERLVERAEREEVDQRALAQRPLAPALEAGDQAGDPVERLRLVVGTGKDRPLQAAAVVQQVGHGDVAAHAVAQQEDRQFRVLLADMVVQAGQVADHLAPAALVGEVAQLVGFGGPAVAALVDRIEVVAGSVQRGGETLVATGVLGHAVGQHHRADGRCARPVAGV